jgi:hypothetical protein
MTENTKPQTEEEYRAAAQDQFADEDLAIDADAKVIPAEDGAWVQAWVRVDDSK